VRVSWRRAGVLVGLAAVAALAVALLAALREPEPTYAPAPALEHPVPEARVAALLAVGDTGRYHPWRPWHEGQRSVARGMVAEDRRAPVDALVLLGDNFYPDGLLARELVTRIRANLVKPYCRFADLSGPRSTEVAEACELPAEERRPVPILAVLGNHDHNAPESPRLQRDEIPEFLPNWSLPAGAADVVEIAEGLSLVRVDAQLANHPDGAAELRAALERAAGPFRVVALHLPIAIPEAHLRKRYVAEVSRIREALAGARNPPQLVLAGHEHNLQAILLDLGGPALHVIAGGGSNARRVVPPAPVFEGRVFAMPATGFARVDLLGQGAEQGLLVSLFHMPRWPWVFWREPQLVSGWWVEASGEARRVYPPNNPSSASASDSTG
jgi:hypothetical protein